MPEIRQKWSNLKASTGVRLLSTKTPAYQSEALMLQVLTLPIDWRLVDSRA
jgi:hypothetical protein